jgi:hypothetical protein
MHNGEPEIRLLLCVFPMALMLCRGAEVVQTDDQFSRKAVDVVRGISAQLQRLEPSTAILKGYSDGVRSGGSRRGRGHPGSPGRGPAVSPDYFMDEFAWLDYGSTDLRFSKGGVAQEPEDKNGGCHIDLSVFRKIPTDQRFANYIPRSPRRVVLEIGQAKFEAITEEWYGGYRKLTFEGELRSTEAHCRLEVISKDDSFNERIARTVVEGLSALGLEESKGTDPAP